MWSEFKHQRGKENAMSIEQALIAQAQPFMVTSRLRHIKRQEISKGCSPEISMHPVALEPHFDPIWMVGDNPDSREHLHWVYENPIANEELVRLQVWISPDLKFDWIYPELFVKQLQAISFRSGFEVAGNNEGIIIDFVVNRIDLPVITAAFNGEFELCELTPLKTGPLDNLHIRKWADLVFRDYFPPPPYSHLLTRPPELHISPLTPLISAISTIEAPAVGLYQVLFEPVPREHNWHRNVEILLDIEYTIKLQNQFHFPQKYAQQSPSGDLHQMAWDVENKAHTDKPFYVMALRVAVIGSGEKGGSFLASMATFAHLFQHGGRPLDYITEREYANVLPAEQLCDMFCLGLTYRPGFLVNSLELTGPVHVPPLITSEQRPVPMQGLEMLPVRNPELLAGTWVGTCDYVGDSQRVCIPADWRTQHTHLIGKSGVGKSTTLEHMILEVIKLGHGVAVFDPHGDMVEELLRLIPECHVERTIYLNPGDPDWVPIWNPLERIPGQDIGRTANDLVAAIKSFVESGGWGDRLANILRNMFFALLHLPGATFLDISSLLRNKSTENESLVKEILKVVENPSARQFWQHDYKGYAKNDLSPPINKLSKLLISGTVSLMLSQPENRFHFRNIMDNGNILLIDLSNMGVNVRQVLGCFILSLLHINALSRSDLPTDDRKEFHIFCDEAHNFITDSIENLIVETRKYGVSLNLAHQYLAQFTTKKKDALSIVGSSIIFKVDQRDAEYLAKNLQGKAKADDLISLGRGEAFVRTGTDVVRVETRRPLKPPGTNFRDQIIEQSRRRYYKPVREVLELIRRRGDKWNAPLSLATPPSNTNTDGHVEEFFYEEFRGQG